MKEKPKKSVRMWVARDKDGSLYLYKNKPLAQYDYKKKHFREYTCYYQ